jgi:PKD repeat protein
MNLKRFQRVSRLVVVIGLLFISLGMTAPPVPAVLADFPAGLALSMAEAVGFDGSASLDSENPPYFTQTSATFLNPSAVHGTASYTWPGGAITAWPDFAWWYGFTTNARSYTTYEFSLVGAHPGPDWCLEGYPQLRLVARGYPGYLPVDSRDGHYLATFPWPVELYAIKVYGRGCNVPGYHEDWGFVLNLLSVDSNPILTATPTPTPTAPPVSLRLTDAQGNAVNGLGLTADDWPAPNPLTLEITLNCPAGGDCAYPFTLRIDPDERLSARFYVYGQDLPGIDAGCNHPVISHWSLYSYRAYATDCLIFLPAGGSQTLHWFVWIQPSDEAELEFHVGWGPDAGSQAVTIPRAAIHPIVFLPGLGATTPPTYDQTNPGRVLFAANQPWGANYSALYLALQKMGYDIGKTFFVFPYDWLQSNLISAKVLRQKLDDSALVAAATPWVAGSPQPEDVAFDLIGHSTGNLVARSYIQVDQWTDPTDPLAVAYPIWRNGSVRRWVSIAGPLQGLPKGYTMFESVTPDSLNPIDWLAIFKYAPARAYQAGYGRKVCVPLTQLCRYSFYTDANLRYQYAHDPIKGITILPEFLPTYETAYLQDAHTTNFPFGRMANPLLESGSVVTGNRDEARNGQLAGKVFDPYTGNPHVNLNSLPFGFATTYYGLNTPDAMDTLNTRLGGVGQNVCVIYGGGNAEDTIDGIVVSDPRNKAPYWFNGRFTANQDSTTGDKAVPKISADLGGLWQGGQPQNPIPDIDKDFIDAHKVESNHQFIVGYDVTITRVAKCLTGLDLPAGLLSGFTTADDPKAESANAALTNRTLSITALSPVELTLIDSLGRRLGYDPATGGEFSEIPDAYYFRDQLATHKYLILYAPDVGDYTLSVTGTGSGSYTLMGSFTEGTEIVNILFATGTINPGEVQTQALTVPETAGEVPAPPALEAGPNVSAKAGEPVAFSGAFTDINPTDTHTLAWDFGDGSPPVTDTLTPTHTYVSAGVYTATLSVTDSTGFVISDPLQITINEVPTATPTATSTTTETPTPTVTATETATSTLTPTPALTPTGTPTPASTPADTSTPTPTGTSIHYLFTGFFMPVNNQPTLNVLKAGSAVPVKFSLGGYQGMGIFVTGYPVSTAVVCGSTAEDAIEQTVTAGGSSLAYDASTNQYIYVWKTDKTWADTCRTLVLKLSNGTYHRADFKFTK